MLNGERLLEKITDKENESILGVLFDHYFDSKHEDEPNVEDAYKEFSQNTKNPWNVTGISLVTST